MGNDHNAKTVQEAQNGNIGRHEYKSNHSLVLLRVNELREKRKIKHDRLGIEQGDEHGFFEILTRRDLDRRPLTRFGKDHSKTQPSKVGCAHPFQGQKQMRIRLQQSSHAGHRHPQQNLVTQNQACNRGNATPHAALGGRGN